MKLPQILLGLCFMLLLASTIDAQDECTSVLDLAFIVDSSGSIRDNNPADRSYDNWLLALNFISNLVGKLPVSKERTRIGLVKFSNIGKVEFHLDQYELQSQVQSAVLNLAYVGGNTNTTGGLMVAKEEIFNVNHGDRSDVPNVAIVITDGKSTYDAEKTIDSAELLRAAGVKVFVVGISDAVKVSELEGISSAPHKEGENYFTSADFQKLDAIVEKVIEETCRPIVPDECDESKMDLVFVLDSSGSIRDNNPQDQSFDNWVLVLQFVINIVNRLSIGAARVGVVKFSNVGENVFYLNTHSDKAAIISAVQSIKYVGGNTNTSGGIRVMRTEQFVGMRGDRSDIQNIAIVITDGSSTFDKDLTIPEAELARQQGIRMYSVGITRNVNDAELKAMSSVPQEQDQQYWVSTDFTALTKIVDTLVKQACAPSTPTLPPMDHLIDVVFILDSSRAVGSENWKLMLEFVVSLAERMVVGFSGIRIGVVRYSNIAESMIYLNSYYDMVSMKNAILNIGYLGSFTNTAGGIREMHYMQYNIARGARASIYNYAILISGGASDIDSRLTLSDAKAAKEDGIRILCIAVGSGVYADELAQISSEPNIEGRTYWKVGNYQDLPRYREEILSETKLTTPAPTIRPDCATNVVDLVFVLDGSGSIRDNNPTDGSYDNWELLLDFVSTVIDRLSIGFSQSRVGIVKYSKDVESVFYLDTYMDKGAMMNAVRSISYMGSFTNTAGGIREMHYNQFTSQHGDRSNVQNIAIIITDGQSNVDEQTTIPEAIAARNDGIRILTVGITNAVDEKELKEMSSMPQLEKMTYWMSTDFTTLGNVINAVVEETCATQAPATPATTTPRAPSKDCVDNVADLVFVLDNSGSIRDNNPVDGSYDNWNLLLDFVANIVRQLDIGSSATRVGVVSYSRDAQSKFYLNTFSDKNRLIDAVLDLEYVGSFTNTSGGLREMHFKQFSSLYGDRPLVQDIAIVITDGVSNVDEYRTISDAVAAQKDGIKILSVGITDSVKEEELREISSAPQTEGVTYWKSTDFLKLGEVIDAIVVETCADAPVPVIPGDTGHTGHTGLQGATGSHGATGFTGFPGRDGEIGKEGSVGATGPRGNSGFPGRDGNTGSTGASGYVGRDGQPGRNGATGESGRQGIPGVGRDGFPGATGFPGRDGSTGHTGLGGRPGSSGDTGSTGRDGLRGSDGATGIPGQPGSDGRKGDQGATGFNGRAGSNGATGFQGRDGATGSTGREGRIGATGRQGLEGSTGYTGSKGRDGMTGSTGSAGFPGRDGATGRIGEAGRDGRTGSTGATGFIGRDGATGATGFEGRKGSTGSSGAQGRPGFDGRPGNAGKEGITGSTGRQGSTGATGFEGRPGAMGVTGPQGRPGSMGPGGLPGRRGSTGVKGFDGRTGDTGHTGGTGLTGREGRIGATGRLGSTGHTGDEGLHGATGREGRMGSTGLSGQIGATGIGRTGATGFTGREGRFGAPGLTGNEGRTGSTGRVGSPGSTGQNGITGSTGTTGPAGRDGLAGSTGATGNIGRIGDTGSTGRDGRIGDAGSTGLEGKAGATGLAGFDGRDGFPGVEGKIGSTGFNGLPGLDGRSGDSGHTGVPGRTGPAGRPGFDGLSGDTGVIGRQGSTGLRGDPGITGKTGSTGRVGESGNAGATGASGFQGRDGENGRNGVDGRTGLTGATGREGLVGATGRNGNDGRTGSTGATGFPGADGRVGERGFAGREGNAGATGREGKQGDTGFNGLPGNTGSTGRPGFDGRPGSTGSTGRTGRTGETGSRGATGFAGREGLTGSTGNTGDRGLTGLEGKIGATGRPGLDGGKGSTGSAGRQGFDGRTGDTGATGTFGRTGERGFEGKIGSTGRQGRNGVDGRPGASGVTGRVGSTGLRGLDGRDGSNGKTGSTGIRGFDGRRGLDGKTGSTGATGFSGRDGATGLPGRDGKIGSTGPSGSDGRIGATGLAGRDGVGRTGANGALGRRGFNGAPGFDGKTGSTGATGERGFVGETGRTGRDGAVGATGEGRTGATGRDGLPGREGPAGYTGERGSFGRAGRTGATGPAGPRGAGCAVNECYGNNGGCSHLCIDTYDSFHCACRPGYVQPQIPINCPGVSNLCEQSVLDLVFVIDSSGSIRKANPSDNSYDNWELMLRFVNSIVDGLNIGLQQTRIGVVKFSNLGLSQFYLRDYDNKQSVKDAVYRISYDDGNTNTSGGLKEMTFNQFRFDQGDRPEVPNIAIVLTDGISTTDNILTVPSAEEAHRRGIKVFSVGVTTSIDEEELRLISSSPQEMNRNYFTSANFQDLNLLTQQILTETCTTRGADNLYCETSIFEDVQCYCKYNVCSILTVNSTQCVDVNECLFHNGECQQDCVNLVGSYRCECGEGYTLREDYHTCADIDECRNNPCAPGDLCTNTYGSYVCLREGGVAGLEGLNQMKMEDSANPVTATALIGASVISALVAIVGAIVIMLVIRRSLKSKQTTQRKAKDSENHNAAPVDPNMSFNSMVENLHF